MLDRLNFNRIAFCQTLCLIVIAKLIPVSHILGSSKACFTVTNILGPLATLFGGLLGGLLYSLVGWIWAGKISLLLSSGLPHLFAGQYWRSESIIFKVSVPLICMLLFWSHPVGLAAGWYATFWLIPVIIAVMKMSGSIWQALGATFVAHAVGSVI